jgi:hypothetical protein
MTKCPSIKIAFNPKTRRNNAQCPNVMDKFKRDEQLGLTAVTAPVNICEGILSGSDQCSRRRMNIMDFTVNTRTRAHTHTPKHAHTDVTWKNQNDKIVCIVDLGDFLHWWENDEEEFQTLNKSSQKCTLCTNHQCNQR